MLAAIAWGVAGCAVLPEFPLAAVEPADWPADRTANPPAVAQWREEDIGTGAGQMLPVTARLAVGDRILDLEVARTDRERAVGLMFRRSLPDDRGMLFLFDPPRRVRFWMKNTLIPLDMIFLREGRIVGIVADAPPCDRDPCPTYGPEPSALTDSVLELRGGRAAELGLTEGDRLDVVFLD